MLVDGPPEAFGFARGAPLSTVGRAARWSCEGGELWALDDRRVAERLLALGARGVGGFVRGGAHEGAVWLVREAPQGTIADLLKQATPWDEARPLILSLARALDACEREGLFPGPLGPRALYLREGGIGLRAEPLVLALVSGANDVPERPSARWMPPEQARGAPWDNAANRYVLGLLLYRMIAGEHAFAGKGLRLGLDEQASRGAPPFAERIARALPPGMQSLCLRMLDPTPSARPASARVIVDALERVSAPSEIARDAPPIDPDTDSPRPQRRPSNERRPRSRKPALTAAALIAAVGMGALLLAFAGEPPRAPVVRERPLLTAATTRVSDCAGCHPRQSAEWHRSIMAHSATSPLFQGLEILIEEQVGRDFDCEHGAGILRGADPSTACRDRASGIAVTGSGGELWCVNCHAPRESIAPSLPAWDAESAISRSRLPLRDLLPDATMEGIGCAFCHQAHGPVEPGSGYQGNPFWTSTRTGRRFAMRPEDRRGLFGIGNSGYLLEPRELLASEVTDGLAGGVHARPSAEAQAYLRSSELCGACHDVRLFGSDGLSGEPFRRLRNAYSEWVDWADDERRAGRVAATCQDCHMSRYPGVCADGEAEVPLPSALARACPEGTHFEPRAPGDYPDGIVGVGGRADRVVTHYLSGVDVPLTTDLALGLIDDPTLDALGIPLGAEQRRDLLLGATFRFELGAVERSARELEIPVILENVGAGHRVPAGFSQEREIWVHLRVVGAEGAVLYEVGRVDRPDEDLHDKVFLRVTTETSLRDARGRPLGLFGADIADGPDVPRWSPPPELGGTEFRGLGLINLQNGFLRCVRCIGIIDAEGRCQPGPGQGFTRADRYADGSFDIDTGVCRSNLTGQRAFFETYFPVGSLDASRGVLRGPDAIIDTRSAPPNVPLRYVYDLPIGRGRGPLTVEARLLFRAFPPFLIRAFADYERARARAGLRPSGPLVTEDMLARLEVVELARVRVEVE